MASRPCGRLPRAGTACCTSSSHWRHQARTGVAQGSWPKLLCAQLLHQRRGRHRVRALPGRRAPARDLRRRRGQQPGGHLPDHPVCARGQGAGCAAACRAVPAHRPCQVATQNSNEEQSSRTNECQAACLLPATVHGGRHKGGPRMQLQHRAPPRGTPCPTPGLPILRVR